MNKMIVGTVAGLGLFVACGGATTSPVDAGNPTQVTIITDWSGNGEGYRVVEVPVKDSVTRVCIERRLNYGGGFSSDPKGASVSISCETQPR